MWHNRSSLVGKIQITIWNFPNSEHQDTHIHAFYPHTSLLFMTNYFELHCFNLFLRLFYCIISSFLYFRMISEQNLWQIHVDGAHFQSGFPRNIMSSILLVVINLSRDRFLLAVLFLIVYREYFNITFYYSFIYSFIRF